MEGVKDGRCGTKTAEHGSCGNIFAKCPARQRMRSREVPRLGRKRKLLSELTAAVQEKASDFHSGAPDDVQATPRVRCRPPESSCAPLHPGRRRCARSGPAWITERRKESCTSRTARSALSCAWNRGRRAESTRQQTTLQANKHRTRPLTHRAWPRNSWSTIEAFHGQATRRSLPQETGCVASRKRAARRGPDGARRPYS